MLKESLCLWGCVALMSCACFSVKCLACGSLVCEGSAEDIRWSLFCSGNSREEKLWFQVCTGMPESARLDA